jgi:hypothetical protein
VIAWAAGKARRVGGRLDTEVDAVIDVSLDRLHEVVAGKLAGHPALAELIQEAEASGGEVSSLTQHQAELALMAAARVDDAFGQAVTELLSRLREAERAAGSPLSAGPGSVVFTGDAEARAEGGGIAIGQAGVVNIDRGPAGPSRPGRASH